MYLINDLENQVLEAPYNQGYRHLRVLSGYVSPIFVRHVLETYSELRLEITVGMVSMDGLGVWHHQAFLNLINEFSDRLELYYQISRPGNHRKVYHWSDDSLVERVFVGSANFTMNGFVRQREVLVESTFINIEDVFADLNVVSCDSGDVEEYVRFYNAIPRPTVVPTSYTTNNENSEIENETSVDEVLSTPTNIYTDYVDISLTVRRTGEVPSASGLNWGQRDERNRNEAYLSVPQSIHASSPTFFPPLASPFLVITDDGDNLICVMAQANRKGIHTRESNSIMGAYFRRRLGLPDGEFVTAADLHRYGRDSVRIYKIDDETYYLDFSS